MSSKYNFNMELYAETEKPEQLLPLDTHNIILHRYQLAANLASGRRILEVGCGSCIGLQLLSQVAYYAVGGEYSSENINHFKHRFTGLNIVCMDGEMMPFAPMSFDLIVALAMVYYLDMPIFLKEASRILTTKGQLFFCTSNHDVPGFVKAPYTTRYYSIPELNILLHKHGFNSNYYGAFPAFGKTLIQCQIRAFIKNIAKSIITILPGGKKLWLRLREKSMGEHRPLPDKLPLGTVELGSLEKLSPHDVNRRYRVIYIIADKYSNGY